MKSLTDSITEALAMIKDATVASALGPAAGPMKGFESLTGAMSPILTSEAMRERLSLPPGGTLSAIRMELHSTVTVEMTDRGIILDHSKFTGSTVPLGISPNVIRDYLESARRRMIETNRHIGLNAQRAKSDIIDDVLRSLDKRGSNALPDFSEHDMSEDDEPDTWGDEDDDHETPFMLELDKIK